MKAPNNTVGRTGRRRAAGGGVRIGAQQLLPVGAAGVVGHRRVDLQREPVARLGLELVAALVGLPGQRQVGDRTLVDLQLLLLVPQGHRFYPVESHLRHRIRVSSLLKLNV
ncbi:hypothetical protein [Kitasatospora sp. NA04385]|uniref:hypothetical protein n=1 Tax=Kitasatospora sp. NA04385 TaxID=2742135 RepID=UPI0020CADCCA|nr:hypothetical protein [Kitasatospora sp. NA04385]